MRILWIALLVGFVALNAYAYAAGGLSELVTYLSRLGPWGIVATADLVLSLFVGITWMRRDAHSRGVSAVPYVLLTLTTGSPGLLLYLAAHGGRRGARTASREHAASETT